jgi:hypothetical protein
VRSFSTFFCFLKGFYGYVSLGSNQLSDISPLAAALATNISLTSLE